MTRLKIVVYDTNCELNDTCNKPLCLGYESCEIARTYNMMKRPTNEPEPILQNIRQRIMRKDGEWV